MHASRYGILRARLVELREAKGLTQMDIALQLGKPQSYVSKYERGERRLDIVELIAVTKVLGLIPRSCAQNWPTSLYSRILTRFFIREVVSEVFRIGRVDHVRCGLTVRLLGVVCARSQRCRGRAHRWMVFVQDASTCQHQENKWNRPRAGLSNGN